MKTKELEKIIVGLIGDVTLIKNKLGIQDSNKYNDAYPEKPCNTTRENFKVGSWIVCKKKNNGKAFVYNNLYRVAEQGTFKDMTYVCEDSVGSKTNGCPHEFFMLATIGEIRQHLIKEAEKRGFKKGVKFMNAGEYKKLMTAQHDLNWSGLFYVPDSTTPSKRYNMALCDESGIIYYDGKWAEIIKEPELTFGGRVCSLILKGYNDTNDVKITCEGEFGWYSELKEWRNDLNKVFDYKFGNQKVNFPQYGNSPTKFIFGCIEGTTKEIDKILTACEKLLGKC